MCGRLRALLFLVLALPGYSGPAAETPPSLPGPEFSYLHDASGTKRIEDVVPLASEFVRLPDRGPRFFTPGAGVYWIKAVLTNRSELERFSVLVNSVTSYDITCYTSDRPGRWVPSRYSDLVPMREAPVRALFPAFPVRIPAGGTSTVYLRYSSPSGNKISPAVYSWPEAVSLSGSYTALSFLFIGLFVILILFNFLAGTYLNDHHSLFYALYMISNLVFYLRQKRVLLYVFTSMTHPEWLYPLTLLLNILTGVLFVFSVFEVRSRCRICIWAFFLLAAFSCVVFGISVFAHTYFMASLLNGAGYAVFLLLVALAVSELVAGNRRNLPLVFAFSFQIAGLALDMGLSLIGKGSSPASEAIPASAMLLQSILVVFILYNRNRSRKIQLQMQVLDARIEKEREISAGLRRLNSFKDVLISEISHELTTPLTGIIGLTEGLLDNRRYLPKTLRDTLRVILLSARRLSHLVEDFLYYTELRHGMVRLSCRNIALLPFLQFIAESCAPAAELKRISVRIDVAPDTGVYADETRLSQMLINLFSVAMATSENSEISISSRTGSDSVVLVIRYPGTVVPRNGILSDIEDLSPVDDQAGLPAVESGIGLRITKDLADLHGGALEFEPGRDGRIIALLTLPKADEAAGTDPVAADRDIAALTRELELDGTVTEVPLGREESSPRQEAVVLLVEDDPASVLVVRESLENRISRLIVDRTGEHALELCAAEQVDLVILDLVLRDRSGYEILRSIRQYKNLYELPVLVMTARLRLDALPASFQGGANDFLYKPVDRDELEKRALTLVNLKRTAAYNQTLERQNEIKSTLMQVVTHSFNTPLTSILNRSLTLIRKAGVGVTDPELRSSLGEGAVSIHAAAERLRALVKNLLTSFLLDGENAFAERRDVSVAELLELIAAACRGRAERRRIDFVCSPPDEEVSITADPQLLHEALENLTDNALKYTPEHGHVRIGARVFTRASGRFVRIFVDDTGPGFSEDDRARMFGKFQKLSARPAAGEISTGLGLYLVKRIVEQLEGAVELEDKAGPGARFVLTFRCTALDPAELDPS